MNFECEKLTTSYIESKVSQEQILSKYLGIPLEVINDCIVNNHLINSVFRNDDKNKSMGITIVQHRKKNKLKVRDFGGWGFWGDIYDVVAYVLSTVYNKQFSVNKKQDFYFILQHITVTFGDIFYGKKTDENLSKSLINAVKIAQNKTIAIEYSTRYWNVEDKKIWEKWNIDLITLQTHFIYPLEYYWVNRNTSEEPNYVYDTEDPAYAYYLGQTPNGTNLIKIYHPLRNRKKRTKFITNCNVLEGILNLERSDYEYIIITKSTKDRLALSNYLNLFYGGVTVGVINLPSENYKLTGKEYNYLVEKLSLNGHIISFLDFDYTGRQGALYMKETYGIPYIFITNGEFGLPNYGAKDFTDLHYKYTKEQIKNFIKKTFDYVKTNITDNIQDVLPF